MTQPSFKADFLLVLVSVLAALGWILSKESLAGIEPLFFMGSRFLLAGLILAIAAHAQLRLFNRRDLGRVLLVGLVFFVAISFWIQGLHYGAHLGIGGFLVSVGILLAPCVSLLFGDRPGRMIWIALPIGFLGLLLLALDQSFHFGQAEWFYLASALMFSLYINLNSKAAARTAVTALTACQLMVVGVLLLPISYFTESWEVSGGVPILAWFVASVLIATTFRFLLQTYTFKLAPTSHAAVLLTLEPVWVAILGVLWYDETMSVQQALGCLLIFLAVLLSRAKALLRFIRQIIS